MVDFDKHFQENAKPGPSPLKLNTDRCAIKAKLGKGTVGWGGAALERKY